MKTTRRTLLKGAAIGGLAMMGGGARAALGGPAEGLKASASARGIQFGIATNRIEVANPALAELIARNASVTLTRNDMKWGRVEAERGTRDYARARTVSDFAERNGLALRGHNVVWAMDVFMPDWFVEMERQPRRQARRDMKSAMWHHAHRLEAAFPQVQSWDVVNEAVNPRSGKLRNSVLTRTLGERYFDLAFHIMRAKAPRAQLVYNDAVDWRPNSAHRNGVLRLLEGALKRDIPIDAVGIEGHLGPWLGREADYRGWSAFLDELADLGLPVIITELDCDDRNLDRVSPSHRDRLFAEETERYLDLTLDNTNVRQVVAWTAVDTDIDAFWEGATRPRWIPANKSFLGGVFDTELRHTPTYAAIDRALRAAPLR